MNTVNLIGNVVNDVELKYTPSGMALASVRIAVKRQFKDKTTGNYESDFINCKAFSKTAELLANYTSKGSKVGIQGSIQTGSYEKSDGTKVYTTDVIVNQITLLDSKKKENNSNQNLSDKDPFDIGEELPF